MAALIAAQRDEHQIPHAVACRALGVSRSWFYKWKDGTLTVDGPPVTEAALAARASALPAPNTATATGTVNNISLGSGGSGYTNPTVSISGAARFLLMVR